MSREDPQFKLRMPLELRARAEQAAKAANRSLNAELVARLEASFIVQTMPASLIPAKRAKELALLARTQIPSEIRKRAIESIAQAIRLGQEEAFITLSDMSLDFGIPDQDLEKMMADFISEMENAGYKADWSDIGSIHISF